MEFRSFGKLDGKLVSICKFVGADTYLSGSGGIAYIDENLFSQVNIKIQWHNYKHPIYTQRYAGFQPNMSIIDKSAFPKTFIVEPIKKATAV